MKSEKKVIIYDTFFRIIYSPHAKRKSLQPFYLTRNIIAPRSLVSDPKLLCINYELSGQYF